MKRSSWLLIALAALLIAIAPLAQANPADPSWIAGIYDDGDFDDVVALITQDASSVNTNLLDGLCPRPCVGGSVPPIAEQPVQSHQPSSGPARGPPAA